MFTIRTSPEAPIPAELVEVLDRPRMSGHEQFSLIFRAPRATTPLQRTYDVAHPEMGSLRLFLVPIRREVDGVYFEAAFSCLSTSRPTEA